MKTGKRHIKNGNEFNELFPEVQGEFKTIKKVANLDDTIHLMKEVVATTLEDTQALSKMLEATTEKQTCSNIWNFCFNHLQYTKDEMGKEQVRRPARTWQDREQGVDCDCMSVFIGSILTNLEIPFSFRLTKYNSTEFEHVYIIAHTNHGVLILDAVVHEFNREVGYSAKKDISMELQYLNGFDEENDEFDEIIDNDYPMDAQGLVMDDELLGLEGRAERRARRARRKAKRQTKKTARKERRAEIKKLPKKARSGFKKENIEIEQLVTFFRIGKLKKFYINQSGKSNEITFFDAVKELECTPLTKRANIPDDYFHLLQTNKSKFEIDTTVGDEPLKSSGGRSNAAYIEKRLKDRSFKNCKTFTDTDEDFINGVKDMLNQGTMAKKTAQIIKKEFEKFGFIGD